MKKITFLLLAILPLIAFGQNLAPNPTLNGATDWSDLSAGTTQAYDAGFTRTADGSGSYLINSSGGFNSGIKSVNISGLAAGEYSFSYYVYGTIGDKTKPIVRDNGTSTNIQGDVYTIIADNTWEKAESTFTISGAGTVNIRAMVNSNDDTMDFHVDDFSFTYIPPSGNTLTVNVVGAGDVALTLDQVSYADTDVETLTATAATHWSFDSWSGDLTGTDPVDQTLLMDTDKTVTATFTVDPTFDYDFTFDTPGELEGWTADAQFPVTAHTGGLVTFTTQADGWARFTLNDFPIPVTYNTDPAKYNKVTIKLQNPSATTDELGIAITNNVETTTIVFPMSTSDATIQTYDIDLTQFLAWNGDITMFRLRFADADNPSLSSKPTEVHDIIIDDITFSFDAALNTSEFLDDKLSMFPNPTKGQLNLNYQGTINKVQIFDITGKTVIESGAFTNSTQVNISNLNRGIYLVKLTDESSNSAIKKLIVN